jgi:GT2 family glycosyltransferase
VQFLTNDKNLGFAKANNQALAICKGKYVLFLNPDTLIPEDCLQKCLAFIEEHPQVGALGVRMLDGKGRFLPESKRSFPLPMGLFLEAGRVVCHLSRNRAFLTVMLRAFLMSTKPFGRCSGGCILCWLKKNCLCSCMVLMKVIFCMEKILISATGSNRPDMRICIFQERLSFTSKEKVQVPRA